MLLSRLAENAFWLGRYLERAEDLSRALRAYEDIRLDMPGQRAPGWHRLAALAGVEPEASEQLDAAGFVARVILDRRNPSALLGALHAARENLRRARSLLPSDCWHSLNPIYLRVASLSDTVPPAELRATLQEVLASSRELAGYVIAGMLRDGGFAFLRMGVHLERIDMTLRIASIVAETLMPLGQSAAFEDVRWMGLLKAVGAYGTYRHRYHARADFESALDLLLFEPTFPRSLAFGLLEIGRDLDGLPGNAVPLAALQACWPERVLKTRAALDDLVRDTLPRLAELAVALQSTFFSPTPTDLRAESSPQAFPARAGGAGAPDHADQQVPLA